MLILASKPEHMKKLYALLACAIALSGLQAQTTVVIKLGPNGKDSEVSDYSSNVNQNYGDVAVFASYIWQNTPNSTIYSEKALVQFDLSQIPTNATITSALLDLYADNPTTTFVGNPSTPMNGTNNASYLRRITSAWDEHQVTWNTMPSTTTANQVILPSSTSATQDYIGVNITQLVQDMISNGDNGFMIEPVSTTPSNSMVFRSGDYADSTYWPTLTVTYTAETCARLRPGEEGKDTEVSDYAPNVDQNYAEVPVIASYIWQNTPNSVVYQEKAFIEFDLSFIPNNGVITSAELDLYADNPTTTFVGNPSTPMNGTNNASYLRRITSPWNEYDVTWNNQPGATSANEVILATSTSTTQDYLNINVATLVQDMVSYGNYGFLIEPVSTTPSNSMIFRSSDYVDSTYRPTLRVCYTGVTDIRKVQQPTFNAVVYPNPFSDYFNIVIPRGEGDKVVSLKVYNLLGQQIMEKQLNVTEDSQQFTFHRYDLNTNDDILFVALNNGAETKTFKLVMNK